MVKLAEVVDYGIIVDRVEWTVAEFRVDGSDAWQVEAECTLTGASIAFRKHDGQPHTLAEVTEQLREWMVENMVACNTCGDMEAPDLAVRCESCDVTLCDSCGSNRDCAACYDYVRGLAMSDPATRREVERLERRH